MGLEAWLGYPLDWEHIQNTYTSMAPKNLGTMGYTGPAGVYIPSAVQTTAYSTAGLALQYFRDFNASWNQPWNFFASISAVNTSLLAPCNKSEQILSSDAMLRRHVEFTGDLDGVIITNDSWLESVTPFHFFVTIFLPSHRCSASFILFLLRALTLPDAMMASGGLPQPAEET